MIAPERRAIMQEAIRDGIPGLGDCTPLPDPNGNGHRAGPGPLVLRLIVDAEARRVRRDARNLRDLARGGWRQ